MLSTTLRRYRFQYKASVGRPDNLESSSSAEEQFNHIR